MPWKREQAGIDAKLSRLLDLYTCGDIDRETFNGKKAEIADQQAGLRLRLESSEIGDHETVDLAVKAFELSQSLTERWLTADYKAKRTILSIVLDSARLNSEKVEFSPRKPFDLLVSGELVPLIGAMGI